MKKNPLHVWREEVILINADLKIVLRCSFVDGDVFLHSSLNTHTHKQ